MDIVSPNGAIEGAKVKGQSRRPLKLRSFGKFKQNGVVCDKFVAEFDVKSQIAECASEILFVPGASTNIEDEVVCESAVVFSHDDAPRTNVSAGSATHQSNFWHFRKHTAVLVLKAHEHIRNALEKRQKGLLR